MLRDVGGKVPPTSTLETQPSSQVVELSKPRHEVHHFALNIELYCVELGIVQMNRIWLTSVCKQPRLRNLVEFVNLLRSQSH